MILLFSVIISVVIGILVALWQPSFKLRVVLLVCFFLISNILGNLKFYDPKDYTTWWETFHTGVFYTGLASIFFHVIPAVIAYYVTRIVRKQRGES